MKIRIRSRNTRLLWCGAHVLLGGLLGLLVVHPVVQAAPSACLKAEDEAKVRKDEIALLGDGHAAEHAQEREERCVIERRGGSMEATDDAGTASAVGVPPDVGGQWGTPIPFRSVIGVHAVLLPTGNMTSPVGKVMFWSTTNPPTNDVQAYLWDPGNPNANNNMGTNVTPKNQGIADNIWCGGQTLLHDGRLLVAGGNLAHPSGTTTYKGAKTLVTFNPFNSTWAKQSVSMEKGRWYPTLTRLANNLNQVVITSGWTHDGNKTLNPDVEVFTPSADINSRNGTIQKVGVHDPTWFYPFQFLLRNGRMLQAGPARRNSAVLNPSGWVWTSTQLPRQNHYHYGNGILLPGGLNGSVSSQVMLIGGKDIVSNTNTFEASPNEPPSAFTEVLDAANPSQGWRTLAPMPQPRARQNTVILPDGTLVTIGGNSGGDTFSNSQLEALLYKPVPGAPGTWTRMNNQLRPRAYHSTALLLPDARVMSAGDTRNGNPANHTIEIFSPPYLFYKGAPVVRPIILNSPSQAALNSNFQIRASQPISKVVLMAPGATTHANDMHQLHVQLAIMPQANGWVQVMVPSSPNFVPRGYYMLFALNANGVPSTATWLRIV